MPLILWFKYCMISDQSLRKGVVTIFILITLSTKRRPVSIIKAKDTEITMTLPLVEDLLTDSLLRDIPLYFICINLHIIANNMAEMGTDA